MLVTSLKLVQLVLVVESFYVRTNMYMLSLLTIQAIERDITFLLFFWGWIYLHHIHIIV